MHRLNKGISAPLGVIFGVLLAIILVILAVFIAYNISTTAVKSQAGQLVIVGQPVAFYNVDDDKLTKMTFVVRNPTGTNINITGFIIKDETITLNPQINISSGATATIEIYLNGTVVVNGKSLDSNVFSSKPITLSTELNQGYMEIVIITDRGTVNMPLQIVKVGG